MLYYFYRICYAWNSYFSPSRCKIPKNRFLSISLSVGHLRVPQVSVLVDVRRLTPILVPLRQADQQGTAALPDAWTEEASAQTWQPTYQAVADPKAFQIYILNCFYFIDQLKALTKCCTSCFWNFGTPSLE